MLRTVKSEVELTSDILMTTYTGYNIIIYLL
jgi:hypothetical protein